MSWFHSLARYGAVVAIAGSAQAARADVLYQSLTFDGAICTTGVCAPGGAISQSYGDVAGVVDVQYNRDISSFTTGAAGAEMLFYNTGYSNLTNVAYGTGGVSEIFLQPLNGRTV